MRNKIRCKSMQNLFTISQAGSVTHLFRNHVQACLADLNMRTSSEHCDEDIKIERRTDEKALQRGGPLSSLVCSLSPFLRRRGALFSVSYNGQEQIPRNGMLPLYAREISCDNTSTPKTKCALVVRSPHARATATAIVRNLTKSVEITIFLEIYMFDI